MINKLKGNQQTYPTLCHKTIVGNAYKQAFLHIYGSMRQGFSAHADFTLILDNFSARRLMSFRDDVLQQATAKRRRLTTFCDDCTKEEGRVSHSSPCAPQLSRAIKKAYHALNAMQDKQLLKKMRQVLPAVGSVDSTRSVPAIVSGLFDISVNTIRGIMNKKLQHSAVVSPPSTVRSQGNIHPPSHASRLAQPAVHSPQSVAHNPHPEVSTMGKIKVLIREALAIARSVLGARNFQKACARLEAHGVDIGDRYHQQDFVSAIKHDANEMLNAAMRGSAVGVDAEVRSLGIKTDIELSFDAVSVSKTKSCKHGRHNVMLCSAVVSGADGGSKPVLVFLYNILLMMGSRLHWRFVLVQQYLLVVLAELTTPMGKSKPPGGAVDHIIHHINNPSQQLAEHGLVGNCRARGDRLYQEYLHQINMSLLAQLVAITAKLVPERHNAVAYKRECFFALVAPDVSCARVARCIVLASSQSSASYS